MDDGTSYHCIGNSIIMLLLNGSIFFSSAAHSFGAVPEFYIHTQMHGHDVICPPPDQANETQR